jgi:predicted TPR repeat methyltransferase
VSFPGDEGAVADVEINLPDAAVDLGQDEEWYELSIGGETRRVLFHDYAQTYAVPGVYERLFYDELKCVSPSTVCGLLEQHIESEGRDPSELRVLDVGAGNGMVGERLAEMGAEQIVGVDIIEQAAEAAERDRPGVYDDYLVVDLTDLPDAEREELRARNLNCLTSVAALGFGDIPPAAFAEAYNLVEPGGPVGFSIKEEMLSGEDSSGFSRLIDGAIGDGALEVKAEHRYRHRVSVSGEPLYYVAMVAEKARDLDLDA